MNLRVALSCLFLFGAIAVDFTSKLLSIGFDLFFILAAIYVAIPLIKTD